MGKVKQKNADELRYLRGLIRELQKEVRTLRKELQYYKKRDHITERSQDVEISGDSEDTYIELVPRIRCKDCGKGSYDEFEIMDKVFGTCNVCGFREKLK